MLNLDEEKKIGKFSKIITNDLLRKRLDFFPQRVLRMARVRMVRLLFLIAVSTGINLNLVGHFLVYWELVIFLPLFFGSHNTVEESSPPRSTTTTSTTSSTSPGITTTTATADDGSGFELQVLLFGLSCLLLLSRKRRP